MLRLSSSISSPSLSLLPFPFLHPHYHRAFSSYHKKVAIRDSGFESKWRTLSDSEREKINDEHDVLRKQDWKQLTLDQKRDLYTISYGPPPEIDPYYGWKVFGGSFAAIIAGIGLFAFIRSFAAAPPKTTSPEWQEASKERMRKENMNPIYKRRIEPLKKEESTIKSIDNDNQDDNE